MTVQGGGRVWGCAGERSDCHGQPAGCRLCGPRGERGEEVERTWWRGGWEAGEG